MCYIVTIRGTPKLTTMHVGTTLQLDICARFDNEGISTQCELCINYHYHVLHTMITMAEHFHWGLYFLLHFIERVYFNYAKCTADSSHWGNGVGASDDPMLSRVISNTANKIANHKRINYLDDGSLFDRGKRRYLCTWKSCTLCELVPSTSYNLRTGTYMQRILKASELHNLDISSKSTGRHLSSITFHP